MSEHHSDPSKQDHKPGELPHDVSERTEGVDESGSPLLPQEPRDKTPAKDQPIR